ncbi:hypothetical protein WJX84_011775 [Apatococcus fuscideae]|uniref:Uncharacterized protein n=1 Tax=Apatococcus fuscideae TaxID=2026836 RepID=A0AAW1TA71_9CHLO
MLSDHTSHARLEAGRTSGHISVNGDYESMGPHQPPSAAEKLLQRPNASPDYKHHTGRAHDAAAEDSQALAAERTSEWVQDVSSEASGYATDWAEEFAGLTPTSVQTPHAATAGQASGHMHSKLQPQHHSAAKAHQQTPGHLPHGGDAQQLTNKRASHAHIVGSAAEHIFVSDEALPVSQYGHLDGTAARFYDAEESTGLRGNERDVWPANQSRVNDSLSRLQQVSQPLPKQQARADGSGADALQTSLYHRERSRLQEALAMQQARAALHVKRKGAVPGQAAAAHKAFLGPWDSAWDRAG